MTLEKNYQKYKEQHYQKALKIYQDIREDEIRKDNTEGMRMLKEVLGQKQDCPIEKLDEYIEEELKKVEKENRKYLKDAFNIKKRSGHNTEYKDLGIDINRICKDMREKEVEVLRILAFEEKEEKYKYLGYIETSSKKGYAIDSRDTENLNKKLIRKYPKANTIIKIHNHPNCANAIPSKEDDLSALAEDIGMKILGIKQYDDCIISGLDFYSRRQDEKERKKHRVIRKQKYSDKFLKTVLKENRMMAYMMSKVAMEIK